MFKFNFNIEERKETQTNENITNKLTENIEEEEEEEKQQQIIDENKEDEDESVCECDALSYSELNSIRTRIQNEIEFKRIYLANYSTNCFNEKLEEPFIEYVDSYRVKLDENDLLNKINKTHDLVPGKYEGGLKVWELSIDLAHFIYDINNINLGSLKNHIDDLILNEFNQIKEFFMQFTKSNNNDIELNILELGCGHALPTLAVLKYLDDFHSESNIKLNIYLQDFNKQIIENITYENVKKYLENNKQTNLDRKFHFIWGDWGKLCKNDNLIPKNYFNLVLTSETIYNIKNYKKLLDLFKKCLLQHTYQESKQPYNSNNEYSNESDNNDNNKNNNEIKAIKKLKKYPLAYDSFVLLSAKTYYFGCGGNLHEFLKVAESNEYKFNFTNNLLLNDNYPTSNNIINKSDDNQTKTTSTTIENLNSEQNDYKFIKNSNFNSSINSNSFSSSHINIPSKDASCSASSSSSLSFSSSSNIAKQIIKLYFK